jgi:sigma-B regulation protein RsbU (phosphoserine phosphatase)
VTPKFISIKWKFSLAFVLVALGFVGLYVVLAKRTFESDKISYIFESQQRQVGALANSISSQLERLIFDARSIASGYDPVQKKFASATQPIFWEHPQLLALKVQPGANTSDAIVIEKSAGAIVSAGELIGSGDNPVLKSLGNDRYALSVKGKTKDGPAPQLLLVFELKNPVGSSSAGQTIAFASGEQVIEVSKEADLAITSVEKFLKDQALAAQDTTMVQEFDGRRHLVSVAQVGFGGFRFLSFIEEAQALGALSILFRRSLIFIAFSFFASVIIALIVSNRLTQNIKSLTVSTEKIGQGDFSVEPSFASNDEIGVLSAAFFKMASELKRLLIQMVDKARMESELQMARLVQDSLFPMSASYKNGKVRLCGMYKTTTECGGDWWYYYQKDSKLYVLVADATGHGIPAALITSAARSLFAYIKNKDMGLKEIAAAWDQSVYECSNGKVCMTAYILQIDVELGECRAINSCHEPPVVITNMNGKPSASYLSGEVNHAIGERHEGPWYEDSFQLSIGDRLVLFTDGLLAIRSPEGKQYSEKRFLSYLERSVASNPAPDALVHTIDDDFTKLGGGLPLPDDVTLAVLQFGQI